MSPPKWIKRQLCKLATKAPSGSLWVHEINDGFRMLARIENGALQLLTRAGLDWTAEYPATATALAKLKWNPPISTAHFAVFVRIAWHRSSLSRKLPCAGGAGLAYFAFDLLEIVGLREDKPAREVRRETQA
jgi:bifunctional non-homologous end joining protein LigD